MSSQESGAVDRFWLSRRFQICVAAGVVLVAGVILALQIGEQESASQGGQAVRQSTAPSQRSQGEGDTTAAREEAGTSAFKVLRRDVSGDGR